MAQVPAQIDVTWIANYAGPHRVCYRIGSSGPYICTTALTNPNCAGGGQPCGYTIDIMVDNETCDPVTYEGYVQPACENESSMTGRVPFTPVTFIPNPACKKYDITCDNVPVNSLSLLTSGNGYDPLSPPNVVISGGGGAGATGTVTVGDGAITSLGGVPNGAGYTDGTYLGTALVGGSGAGATADIIIVGGIVTAATIISGGSGYVNTDIVNPDPVVVGTPTTNVDLSVVSDYGEVVLITLTSGGSGYTTIPAVIIDPPISGIQATANAILQNCPAIADIPDCTGASGSPTEATIPIGTSVSVCSQSGTPAPPSSQFAVVENGNCLCDCQDITIENTSADTVDVRYIDCNGAVVTTVLNSGGGPETHCIVTNSLTYIENGAAVFSLTVNGSCNAVP